MYVCCNGGGVNYLFQMFFFYLTSKSTVIVRLRRTPPFCWTATLDWYAI